MMSLSDLTPGLSEQYKGQQSFFPLNQIYFYLTEGCNLACRHCWLAPQLDRTGTRSPVLPLDFFEKSIQEAKPLGLRSVKLTGGEPLLHPQFTRLLELVRMHDLGLTVETNGVLCTPEISREIAKSKNPHVSVSLDGSEPESHDRLRGVKGAFKQTSRAIRHLVEAGVATQIIMTVTKFNKNQVEDLISLAQKWAVASVKFNIIQPFARGKSFGQSPEGLSIAEYVALGRHVDLKLAPQAGIPLFFDYPLAFRPLSRLANGGDYICGILGILGVIPGGHYALCGIGKHVPDLVFGTIERDSLRQIWDENKILLSLRKGLPRSLKGICRQCLMHSRCLGACIAQNFYTHGDLWGPFWFCEETRRAGLFPSTRLRNPDSSRNSEAGIIGQ